MNIQQYISKPNQISLGVISWITARKLEMELPDILQAKSSKCIVLTPTKQDEKGSILERAFHVEKLFLTKKVKSNLNFAKIKSMSSEEEALNYYTGFILKHLKQKKASAIGVERHHLVPRHLIPLIFEQEKVPLKQASKALDHKSNIAFLSGSDHLDAHALFFIAGGFYGDFLAIQLRNTDSSEIIHKRRSLKAQKEKENKEGFYSNKFQEKHGYIAQKLKGTSFYDPIHQKAMASKGGSANTVLQQEARSKSGKLQMARNGARFAQENKPHCKKMGLANQSPIVKHRLSRHIRWDFNGLEFISSPVESTTKLIKELDSFSSSAIPDISNFSKLLRGLKKKAYGWSILEVLEN